MNTLAERLRGVVRPSGTPVAPERVSHDHAADVLGGVWDGGTARRVLVVDRRYAPGHRHGRVAVADCLPGTEGWTTLDVLGGCAAPADGVLFVDLETTGLAGGAGTYAFLVGCGWFDDSGFRLRQFFLPSAAAEGRLLEAVQTLVETSGCVCLVTYNGKTFDVPVLDTRCVLQRLEPPFAGLAHVDMLHHARRLWAVASDAADAESQGCRLTTLERTLCGHEREGDVPGFEIPARYFHFVRTGDAGPLVPVLEHNRLDILALAAVTARAAQLLGGDPDAATAREALGVARLLERAGRDDDAVRWYGRAEQGRGTCAEALRGHAMLLRRRRQYGEAAEVWRRLLGVDGCAPALLREATAALAVHHEHRVRDLHAARTFALRALDLEAVPSRQDAVRHRLDRLERKLRGRAASASSASSLFGAGS